MKAVMKMPNGAVILLSGGLDSLVALGYLSDSAKYNIELALTFDYGQKSAAKEIESSKKICKFYNIKHKVIKLGWLKDITKTALVTGNEIPNKNFGTHKSMEKVWVPNRNGLFLNIAATFCDSYGYKYIIYGANKDEGDTFSDNTEVFRADITKVFETSTLVKPRVIAPLINYGKDDIVKIAVEKGMPLECIWSCYYNGEKHCGNCESCYHLKKSLKKNGFDNYLKIFFENEDKVYK